MKTHQLKLRFFSLQRGVLDKRFALNGEGRNGNTVQVRVFAHNQIVTNSDISISENREGQLSFVLVPHACFAEDTRNGDMKTHQLKLRFFSLQRGVLDKRFALNGEGRNGNTVQAPIESSQAEAQNQSEVMRLATAILLTQILIVSSFNVGRAVNIEMNQPESVFIRSGRVKRDWWKNLGSKIGSYFYGQYGGGTGNNYGGTNIERVKIINLNFSIGRKRSLNVNFFKQKM
uniref:Uncharacterized protein n=1 Tax=Ascaris lumbricoides TaxID=6252 RepID=A0A9J2Q616_ASCLU